MDVVAGDEDLLGAVHVRPRDRLRGIGHHHLDELPGERVDEPGLPAGQHEGAVHGLRLEALPRVRGVLGVERGHLVPGEAPQRERLHEDVERARRPCAPFRPEVDAVVAHVAEAHERERPGEALRPIDVSGLDLAQQGDEDRVAQGVGLVEEDHQRARRGLRPGAQRRAEAPARGRVGPGRRQEIGGELGARRVAPGVEDGQLRDAGVVGEVGARDHRHQQRGVAALGRQLPGEGAQGGRLADLPWGVQQEVSLLVDQTAQPRQPRRRRQHVVIGRVAGARGVEPARHVRRPWESASGGARGQRVARGGARGDQAQGSRGASLLDRCERLADHAGKLGRERRWDGGEEPEARARRKGARVSRGAG